MKTISAHKCSTIAMVAGGEKRHSTVIDDVVVKQWVGIGWVDMRTASAADKRQFPTVTRERK